MNRARPMNILTLETTCDETAAAVVTDRLQVLAGVREFPIRVKCATLAWHTMNAAAAGKKEISTEDGEVA